MTPCIIWLVDSWYQSSKARLMSSSYHAYRTGTLLKRSSSISSSFICLSLTARYSHSRKSLSTSCHCRIFSVLRASLTLHNIYISELLQKLEQPLLAADQCDNSGEITERRSTFAPHSYEEIGRQRVNLVEVEEEWLEGSGGRI
jgi:hypothetical protein